MLTIMLCSIISTTVGKLQSVVQVEAVARHNGDDALTCGAEASGAVLRSMGMAVEKSEILKRLPDGGKYVSFENLKTVLERDFHCHTVAVVWRGMPPENTAAGILHLAQSGTRGHFVAVIAWAADSAQIDENDTLKWVDLRGLRNRGWQGATLHVGLNRRELYGLLPHWWELAGNRFRAASVILLLSVVLLTLPLGRGSGSARKRK
jgi:hypothetical protein